MPQAVISKTPTLKKMPDFNPLSISEYILKKRRTGEVCLKGASKCLPDWQVV